jgi:small subunit ribosomal protein S16
MLVIRLQRTGRKGHAMFRVVVQDSRLTPTSGKVVVRLGSYDPHSKTFSIDKEKASFYLEHGAQPSERMARLLKDEGLKLPDWVKVATDKKRAVRNPDKRRSTRPEAPAAAAPPAETPVVEAETSADIPAELEAEAATASDQAEAKAEDTEQAPAEAETVAQEDVPAGNNEEASKVEAPSAEIKEETKKTPEPEEPAAEAKSPEDSEAAQ